MQKTELCRYHFRDWSGAKKACRYGDQCDFAHCASELEWRTGSQERRGCHWQLIWGNMAQA